MMLGLFHQIVYFYCTVSDLSHDESKLMNHSHEEKKTKAFLFLRVMKCFAPLIIITTSISTTLLPSGMTFNILAMLHPLGQSNSGILFSELLIQSF